MVNQIGKLFQKAGLVLLLLCASCKSFSQDAYMNMLDTVKGGLFNDFIGIKLFATDIGATSLNQDLQFQYTSNDLGAVYKFQHDMNVTGLHNFFNIGIGSEENLGQHLCINFFNTSIGYMQNMWDWSIGTGAGYFVSLNKAKSMRLEASLNIYFESITYSFGDYYDSTELGFIVNGVNIGVSVKNVKYVNSIWSLNPGIEYLYRRSNIDYFVGLYYNYVFSYHEKVNFYESSVPVSYAIYYKNGDYVGGNIVNLNKYMIQIGIIREFGL